MVDIGESNEQAAVRELGLTAANLERRKRYVSLGADDAGRVASLRPLVEEHFEELTAIFFKHLAEFDESRVLTNNREALDLARKLKREHLRAMFEGDYSLEYATQRVRIGLLYGRVGLDTRIFLGAFHQLLKEIGALTLRRDPLEGYERFMSLKKVAFFDIGLIVDVLVLERERTIRRQQEAIRELSTPVLQIRERLLLLPIIGVIDTHRARGITENLLREIRTNRAKVVVMDVTGVATIDSKVANHLLQTVTAAKLMGATVVVTGLSSEVAQSLVALGIELTRFNTVGDLQGGLEEADRILGYRTVRASSHEPQSLPDASA